MTAPASAPEPTTSESAAAPPLVAGLGALAHRYDALLVDLWGCLHDGIEAHGSAVDALLRFRAGGGKVVLVSNAPRRNAAVARQLGRLGVPAGAYDAIMTAGETLRLELAEGGQAWHAGLGDAFFDIGAGHDAELLDGLRFRVVAAPKEAGFVLCRGPRRHGETLACLAPLLDDCLALSLPLASANPDRFVLRGRTPELCAGSIALAYRERGGDMRQEGKPYAAIYRRCLRLLDGVPAERVLALGDGIETDILGADRAGLDALWITGGLPAHDWGLAPEAPPPPERVARACARHGVGPLGVMPMLAW